MNRYVTWHSLLIFGAFMCALVIGAIGYGWIDDPNGYVWTWLGVGLALKIIGDEL